MSGIPIIVRGDGAARYEPIPLAERLIDENWLQHQMDVHPELLPIADISSSWGPLVSLGREVRNIDNLFVSPTGELTVVEAKLWRNPEARRKVVAQILEYAAMLSQLTYEQFDEVVKEKGDGSCIWDRVCAAFPGDHEAERRFVDTLTRNLRAGRFLLLIVGDGIREDLSGIAVQLGQHPGLQFHLELVEMKLFRRCPADQETLIVPTLVGRTQEVRRAVVEIRSVSDVDVTVSVAPGDDEDEGSEAETKISALDEFVERSAAQIGTESAEAIRGLVEWWAREMGGRYKFGSTSVTLLARYGAASSRSVSVMNLGVDGRAMGSVAPISQRHQIVDVQDLADRFRAAGFLRGSSEWPVRQLDLAQPSQLDATKDLLTWIALTIQARDSQSSST